MDAITDAIARAHLADVMDRVCDNHETIIITRNGRQTVIMMSLVDYRAMEETAYLLRAPRNARRLLEATAQFDDELGSKQGSSE